jgi:fructokinase
MSPESPPPIVAVCGEALIDLTEAADGRFDAFAGGGPFNTAIALGRLGMPAMFLGRTSTDRFGDQLRTKLAAASVHTVPTLIGPEPTPIAIATTGAGGHAEFRFHFEGTASRLIRAGSLPPLLDSVRALMFGTLGMVLEPAASAYEALMFAEVGSRALLLDPNVRPKVIPDGDAYRGRFEGWVRVCDVVKFSDIDAGWLYPGRPFDEVIGHLLDLGAGLVVITRGEDGLIGATTAIRAEAGAPKVSVADTIGAGDTVFASIADGLTRIDRLAPGAPAKVTEGELSWILARAAAAAAITVSRPGADPPWLTELPGWSDLPGDR